MNNLSFLLPEILVVILGFGVLTIDFFIPKNKKWSLPYIAILALTGIFIFNLIFLWGKSDELYGGILRIDGYSLFFKSAFLILGAALIASSVDYVNKNLSNPGEYYAILIFTVLAMMLLSSSGELLTAYIAVETLSFGLYVLVAFDRYNIKSNEAGTKYIILGALSSAILLFGISQIYGLLGTTQFNEMAEVLRSNNSINPGLLLGFLFLIAGLGFKVASVPFHMWAPDVYEGSPTSVTLFFAVVPKVAALTVFIRFLYVPFISLIDQWQSIIIFLSLASMIFGAVAAIGQKNLKRLIAYSSIGHMGYALAGLSVGTNSGIQNSIIYLCIYLVMNLGVFCCLFAFKRKDKFYDNLDDLSGLSKNHPVISLSLLILLFSLAGIPPMAGFFAKFYIFTAVIEQSMYFLAIVGLLSAVISAFYYLRIIKIIYFDPEKEIYEKNHNIGLKLTLILSTIFIIAYFIYPSGLTEIVSKINII